MCTCLLPQNFQLPLKCFFRLTPPVTVDASVTKVAGEEKWDVLCEEVNVSCFMPLSSLSTVNQENFTS